MSESVDLQTAKERVLGDADREVWVVQWNAGGEWRVGAVLPSHDAAEAYRDDLRAVLNSYPDEFPEQFKTDFEVCIRHGGRHSGSKMFEAYPPEDQRS